MPASPASGSVQDEMNTPVTEPVTESFTESSTGILLLNLGTPDRPDAEAVGRYLRQFLMDGLVVDIPKPLRWFLVNALIVPRRSHTSAEAYSKIWTDRGSPLKFHTRDLTAKVQQLVGPKVPVEFAMRYGSPSVREGLEKLKARGVEKLRVIPLYPQYSLAATESCLREVEDQLRVLNWKPSVSTVREFHIDEGFLEAFAHTIRESLSARSWDHLLFSFHGVPERHVKKTDPTEAHCLCKPDCCETRIEANQDCYRSQCYQTAYALARKLELKPDQFSVSFQSRLGRTPWIRPYTDHLYEELPKKGIKSLAVACPAFVADCLETLEEISMRGLESWQEAGGKDLFLIPSLNSSDPWAKAVVGLSQTLPEKEIGA